MQQKDSHHGGEKSEENGDKTDAEKTGEEAKVESTSEGQYSCSCGAEEGKSEGVKTEGENNSHKDEDGDVFAEEQKDEKKDSNKDSVDEPRKDSAEDDDIFSMDTDKPQDTDNYKPSDSDDKDAANATGQLEEGAAAAGEKGIFRRTLGSVGNIASSIGSSFPGSPNMTSILNYSTGLFHLSEDKDKEKEKDEEKENHHHKQHMEPHSEIRLVDRPDLFKNLDGK